MDGIVRRRARRRRHSGPGPRRLGAVHRRVGESSSRSRVVPSTGATQIPMLARHHDLLAVERDRLVQAVEDPPRRSAPRPRAPGCAPDSSTSSSPPKRATVSSARSVDITSAAASRRTRSPPAWPKRSLTALKPSKSRKSTASGACSRCWRRSAWSSRSKNSARLGRPVSESWSASCSRRSSAPRRRMNAPICAASSSPTGSPSPSSTSRPASSGTTRSPSGGGPSSSPASHSRPRSQPSPSTRASTSAGSARAGRPPAAITVSTPWAAARWRSRPARR